MRVTRDNRSSRVTLFMYFRQNVKPPRFRIGLYQETFSVVNNFVTVHAFYVNTYAFLDVLGINVVVQCFVEFRLF